MVEQVDVIWLPVRDMGSALEFYGQTLGLAVEQQEDEWSMLRAGGTRVGLNARESPSGDGGAVIAFRPADGIETAVDALESAGVEVAGGITDHPWGRVATFKDPDGNDLQLYEPPAA